MYKVATFSVIFSLLFSGCAQFVPPTGGDKDTTPPNLVKSYPENQSLNNKTKTIELIFDEAIDVTNLKQELTVSPEVDGGYEVKNKLNSVSIKLSKELRDSTTYTFNFKNGIKDLNEKNPAKNLRLVFSTGNKIDSLGLTGKVQDLFTKKNSSETTVGLYDVSQQDSIPFYKKKPDYFVKTDSSGLFKFENIRNGLFRVMAFQDINNNLLLDFDKEKAGFLEDTVQLKTVFEDKKIEIYTVDTDTIQVKRRTPRANTFLLSLTKAMKEIKVEDNEQKIPFAFSSNEITFYRSQKNPIDSAFVTLIITDSTLRQSKLVEKIRFLTNTTLKKTNTEVTWSSIPEVRKPTVELNTITIKTTVPLDTIIKDRIIIRKDTSTTLPFQLIKLSDTSFHLQLENKREEKETIEVQLLGGALMSVLGDTNTTKRIEISIVPKSETGQLTLVLQNECDSCFIELLDATNLKVISKENIKKKVVFKDLLSGDYRFRVILDSNQNGIWDNGDLKNNILPEKVYFHPEVIRIKTNFEIEQNIDPFS